jgi:metal-sulfur cluster biosynthetic enzyme
MTASSLSPGQLLESLMYVIDPEVGINIVDLGLIYAVSVTGSTARVEMTLTTPGCPLHDTIKEAVDRALLTDHPSLAEVDVQLVWDPRWNVEFISEEGKRQLGW